MQDQGNKPRAAGKNALDGKKAVAEYEAQAIALRARTERLKALRLAKEAAEGATAPKRPAPSRQKSSAARPAKGKPAAASLSDWLDDQQKSGRRT